jgi:hypothetical protein
MAPVLLIVLAGCLPQDLPPGEPPIPYYMRAPCLSDYEMDHTREDVRDAAAGYLDQKGFKYRDLVVHVWPNLGVAVKVVTDTPDTDRIGQGLVNRLNSQFNHDYYVYRPTGYDFVFKVILSKE